MEILLGLGLGLLFGGSTTNIVYSEKRPKTKKIEKQTPEEILATVWDY